jgi:phosphoribosylanthranilate isomerase
VECSGGPLPGGNALTWNWDRVKTFGREHPLILAGGLSGDNISRAVAAGQPDAVDVSSGVEMSPGQKDLAAVEQFMAAVGRTATERPGRRIFPKYRIDSSKGDSK